MHIPLISGFYAGLLGLLALYLTARVILLRGKTGIAIMDGGKSSVSSKRQARKVLLMNDSESRFANRVNKNQTTQTGS